MDIKISAGDWEVDECGMPVTLTGETQLIQKAFLRLLIPKGSFLHSPELGSRFSEILPESRENSSRLALIFAQQALADLATKITVTDAAVNFGEKTVITVKAITDTKKEVQFII